MLNGHRRTHLLSLGSALGLILFASSSQASAAVELKYSQSVTEAQRALLNSDIAKIQTVKFSDETGETQRILKIPDLSAGSFEVWLSDRIRYVIDEAHPLNSLTLRALARAEYPDVTPTVSASPAEVAELGTNAIRFLPNSENGVDGVRQVSGDSGTRGGGAPSTQSSPQAEARPTIIMGNIGAALYLKGRQNQVLVGLNIRGQGLVPVVSPRVGLLQIGEGLFTPMSSKMTQKVVKDFAHSMFRLTTLFHEARHSDGNSKVDSDQLAFFHETCPDGHDFAGFPACDLASNGPYRVGSLVMKAILDGCDESCSARDQELIAVMYMDSISRILTPSAVVKTSGSGGDMCERLSKVRSNLAFCNRPLAGAPFQAIEWDDAPEGIVQVN